MDTSPKRLGSTFGRKWSAPALFYEYEAALRFELALGEHPIDRFLSAYHRAAAIASSALRDTHDLTLATLLYADSDKPSVANLLGVFRELRACGLPTPRRQSIRPRRGFRGDENKLSFFDEDSLFVFEMTMPISREHVSRVLWAAIGHDLGVRPYSSRLYIASPSRGILLHPYDDRGMDLVGTSIDVVRPYYDEFRDWLLDHDLERMRRIFEA